MHTVQHGTLKSQKNNVQCSQIFERSRCRSFLYFPACPSDKGGIRTKRSVEHWWKDGIWMAHSSESWSGIPLTGINLRPHFSLVCVPVCVVPLRWADPPARGHTTFLMDTVFRN
jgi:hypothetical protein